MTSLRDVVLLFAGMLPLAACGGDRPVAPAGRSVSASTPAASGAVEAKQVFESLCSTCHGMTGHGDGPGAGSIEPKPRSFADAAWQASVSDDHIKKIVVYGGSAVGKSPMMVAQPHLKGKDAVLDGLVQIVRGFAQK